MSGKAIKFKTICRCGKLVEGSASNCPCKKRVRPTPEKARPSNTKRFRDLRMQIGLRDGAHCQRCRIKHGMLIFNNLECHHIKSFRDFPELAYEPTNLIIVCRRCNLDLGNRNKLDFDWEVPELQPYKL
ncbi:HNH endonuclease [Peribacillus butanolivorans]